MSVETLTALSVTKRDGRQVEFQKEKIQRAIEKAEIGLNGELSDERMEVLGRIVEDVLAEISRRSKIKNFRLSDRFVREFFCGFIHYML